MAELVQLEVKELPALRVAGRAIQVGMDMKDNPIPAFWEQCFGDGSLLTLETSGLAWDPGYAGFMQWAEGKDTFTYIVGMLLEAGVAVPEGYDHVDIAPCRAAVGWMKGVEQELYGSAHPLTEAAMERRGLAWDETQTWCMELYTCPRFTEPDGDGNRILDYYIPCK